MFGRFGKFGVVCLVAASAILPTAAAEVDGVAARVGKETILKSDIVLEMRRMNAPASAYVEVRNQMIDRKLILNAAAEAKVTMQEWVIESRIREMIDRAFGGDRNKLMDTLAKQKVSYPDWRSRMKDDMIVAAMRWNVIDKNVVARPADMRREFEEHPDRYVTGGRTTVAVILLKPDDAARRDDVSAALATNDFATVAKAWSADSHAAQGGVWKDIVPADVFKPEICTEIAAMPCGTISRWIELDGWSFLLKKLDETPGKARTFEEAYSDIETNVREAEAKSAYDAWLERLRSETYIKVY